MQMSLNILIPKFTTEIKGQIHSKLATDGTIFLCPKKEKKKVKEALFRHDKIIVFYIKHCKGDGCVFKMFLIKNFPTKHSETPFIMGKTRIIIRILFQSCFQTAVCLEHP